MRLGVFGGSFNPVHYGHLFLAECCREACELDLVLFVPAAVSPLKQHAAPIGDEARVEMLKLAIGGNEHFDVSTIEIDRGGVSYTVDTLEQLTKEHPNAELFFLMGADSLAQFSEWHRPDRICDLANLVVIGRPGSAKPDFSVLGGIATPDRIAEYERLQFEMPLVQFSSSEIRRRVAAGRSIRYRTPRAVEAFIHSEGLYV